MLKMLLLVLLIGTYLAVKLLPWWALLAALAVLVLAMKVVGGRLLTAPFKTPFRMKGQVLRGATAEVHSVEPASPPADDEDKRSWYLIDVTIRPQATSGPFTLWECGELVLAPPNAKSDDVDGDEDSGRIENLEVWQDDAWIEDEGWKLPGEQRLRMLVAVPPSMTAAKFRYYFELFGDVRLPVPALAG